MHNGGFVLNGFTSAVSLIFCEHQSRKLAACGFRMGVVTSPNPALQSFAESEGVLGFGVPMEREILPLADLSSLGKLWDLLRRIHPEITNFGTPKAGLLGGVAGLLARVPCRIYTLHGLRLETARGWKRLILMGTEWVACKCADRVICVSPSLRRRAIELGLVEPEKAVVLGSGTCNGIEVERYLPTAENVVRAEKLRRVLGLEKGTPVVGFVGRFTRDKGIPELVEAYGLLRGATQPPSTTSSRASALDGSKYTSARNDRTCFSGKFPRLRLLLVGDFEDGDPVPAEVRAQIECDASIVRPGFVADTSPYYHLMDVVVLPTYREGFPAVPLEAQAAGKPVVTTSATGAVDSVQDGKTGLLVPVGDAVALARAVGALLDDPAKRQNMGRTGQEWVIREFAGETVRTALVTEYRELIREKLAPAGKRNPQRGWRGLVKRTMDVVCAMAGLVIASPVMMVVALLIWVTMGRPVLFRQKRPGKYGQGFRVVKFRTMKDARDRCGCALSDCERMTRVGRWLRACSLDELPQMWNVLKGDMSLVGPRPLLMEYLDRYTPEQARRHEVMPGVTGWAQVNGRNALSWEEKFALDTWYVEHWGLALDLKILAMTVWRVLKKEGISQEGHATMPEYGANFMRRETIGHTNKHN